MQVQLNSFAWRFLDNAYNARTFGKSYYNAAIDAINEIKEIIANAEKKGRRAPKLITEALEQLEQHRQELAAKGY